MFTMPTDFISMQSVPTPGFMGNIPSENGIFIHGIFWIPLTIVEII